MFTYSHANTALGQSEPAYYLSYFIKDHVTAHLSSLCKHKYHMAYYTLEQELCDAAQR